MHLYISPPCMRLHRGLSPIEPSKPILWQFGLWQYFVKVIIVRCLNGPEKTKGMNVDDENVKFSC